MSTETTELAATVALKPLGMHDDNIQRLWRAIFAANTARSEHYGADGEYDAMARADGDVEDAMTTLLEDLGALTRERDVARAEAARLTAAGGRG